MDITRMKRDISMLKYRVSHIEETLYQAKDLIFKMEEELMDNEERSWRSLQEETYHGL